MNDLASVVDWSRAQFALTAMYHWLFVPLTIGLSLTVAIMETIYYRTRDEFWKRTTKFWMTLFGINFAIGVATGIILEFEFGTNWSNYSWFVGDIFGAPLAIEGIVAFFMEATFIAVMFFGWDRVSRRFHLTATWLTAVGVCLSALWILVANAWMQSPVGMEFDPAQMRNVMTDFWAVATQPVAVNKFFHTVFSGWTLAGVFVVGVSAWLLAHRRSEEMARRSLPIGAWVGAVGLLLTLYTGHGSAVQVARCQPMKLAAMEGLYEGSQGQDLVGFGIVNAQKRPGDGQQAIYGEIAVPGGLSFLANGDFNSFVPGIDDQLRGYALDSKGDTIWSDVSYADRIAIGKEAQQALRIYEEARRDGHQARMDSAAAEVKARFEYFGYGYLDKPDDAVPPVPITFYAFRLMVMIGGYLVVFFAAVLWMSYRRERWLHKAWVRWTAVLTIPLVWICSQSGWVVAEVGRQPWTIQNVLPVNAGVSAVTSSSVQVTFWMFAVLFTVLLVAEVSIMLRQIAKAAKDDDGEAKENSKHESHNS